MEKRYSPKHADGYQHCRAVRGFTLVEMAVVMVLIGIMMTMGISGWLSTVSASANRGTVAKQLLIRDALIAYLRVNGRLPCPDVGPTATLAGPLVAGAVLDGRENRAALVGSDPDPTANCANPFGAVPYADLGLNRDSALDAWGNYMLYRVSNNPVTFSDWVRKANFSSANRGSMWLSDHVSAPAAIAPVVAVLISHGKNGAGAWTTRATQIDATGAGADEILNAAGCVALTCFSRDITESTAGFGAFDDIVLGVTVDDLLSPLIKEGAIKSASAALSTTFEAIIDLVAAGSVKTYVPGPPGSCTYTLPASKVLNDPWGTPVTCATGGFGGYVIGSSPATALCTMTSAGPDRAAGGGDDIVRTVTRLELDSRLMRLGC